MGWRDQSKCRNSARNLVCRAGDNIGGAHFNSAPPRGSLMTRPYPLEVVLLDPVPFDWNVARSKGRAVDGPGKPTEHVVRFSYQVVHLERPPRSSTEA